ncbi:MAG TPA: hypothetical protein PLI71_09900 [Clostridia bacterium]|nr:hypothetical protein [Clostridia bacterium]
MPSPDYYSDTNSLTNAGAESGDLTGWTASGITVVSGGATGDYSFDLSETASMYQDLAPGSEVVALQVSGAFLPEYEIDPDDDVQAQIKVEINYTDGTTDYFYLPAKQQYGI